jgi:hypothetical protein
MSLGGRQEVEEGAEDIAGTLRTIKFSKLEQSTVSFQAILLNNIAAEWKLDWKVNH